MEYEREVFNAASDGQLYRLKVLLDHKSEAEVTLLVSARTNGTTPLIMACRNGHLDVASYLIEECRADIEQDGCVPFYGRTVVEAPPLWSAAVAGHLNLVKCLLKHKASVNSASTSSRYFMENAGHIEIPSSRVGVTCLMAACHMGHYEISKHFVECGADVNAKCKYGSTALHFCAKSGCLDILEMLLQNGAVFASNSCCKTPLISAALTGRAAVVEYFLQGSICTRREKIDALELLGATFVDEKPAMDSALYCWRLAMELRFEDGDCPVEKPETHSATASLGDATEVRTLSQLEELASDPDDVRMRALLVRERILGSSHPRNLYYIRKRAETYTNDGDFDRSIQLWMHAAKALPEGGKQELVTFLRHFSRVMSEALSFHTGYPVVDFCKTLNAYRRVLKEIIRIMRVAKEHKIFNSNYATGLLIVTMHLVGLMCRKRPEMNENEELELKKATYRLVSLYPMLRNRWTPLHLACFPTFLSLGLFNLQNFRVQLEVVDLLLEVGADPNALDSHRNTPLHIALMSGKCSQAVFDSLVRRGAHLDACNSKQQTPLQLAQSMPSLEVYPLRHVNLQCLSAKAVRSHEIPYKGLVHEKLEAFLDWH